jgi:hypothetical protein
MKPIAWLAETPPTIAGQQDALNVDHDLLATARGYHELGYEVRRLRVAQGTGASWDPAAVITRDTPVVSDLRVLPKVIASLEGRYPDVSSYPGAVRRNGRFGPTVALRTLDQVTDFPVFVKSVRPKIIAGFVATNEEDLWMRTAHLPEDEPVWTAAPIRSFIAEWRALVLDGEVVHVGQYRGRPMPFWSSSLASALELLRESAKMPRAFTLDLGVSNEESAVFIECNPGAPCGLYGARPSIAAAMHAAVWEEAFSMAPGALAAAGKLASPAED